MIDWKLYKAIGFHILGLLTAVAFVYLIQPPPEPSQTACTLEAKLCADGTAVGRIGPNCEFAACPMGNASSTPSSSHQVPIPGGEATLRGQSVCLPHRNTSGPQTMECAYGIQTAANTYYAVDLQGLPQEAQFQFSTGRDMKLYGTVVPVEALSSSHWQTYSMVGIIRVARMEIL